MRFSWPDSTRIGKTSISLNRQGAKLFTSRRPTLRVETCLVETPSSQAFVGLMLAVRYSTVQYRTVVRAKLLLYEYEQLGIAHTVSYTYSHVQG